MGRSLLFYHLCFRCDFHFFVALYVVAVVNGIHVVATYSLISLIHYRASVKSLPPNITFISQNKWLVCTQHSIIFEENQT